MYLPLLVSVTFVAQLVTAVTVRIKHFFFLLVKFSFCHAFLQKCIHRTYANGFNAMKRRQSTQRLLNFPHFQIKNYKCRKREIIERMESKFHSFMKFIHFILTIADTHTDLIELFETFLICITDTATVK